MEPVNSEKDANMQKAIADAEKWLSLEGVEGVAQGEKEGEPYIAVFSSGNREAVRQQIPQSLRGFPVVIEDTGPLSAQ